MPTVWPPQGEASFEFKMPCCECAPECSFFLPITYDTLAEAEAALLNDVIDCRCYFYPYGDGPQTNTFSYDGDSFTALCSVSTSIDSGIGVQMVLRGTLPAGDMLISWDSGSLICNSGITATEYGSFSIFDTDLNEYTVPITLSSGTATLNVPVAGCYQIVIGYGITCDCPPPPDDCLPGASAAISVTAIVAGTASLVLSPAIALYTGGQVNCE
jgi:hypothetical protein